MICYIKNVFPPSNPNALYFVIRLHEAISMYPPQGAKNSDAVSTKKSDSEVVSTKKSDSVAVPTKKSDAASNAHRSTLSSVKKSTNKKEDSAGKDPTAAAAVGKEIKVI